MFSLLRNIVNEPPRLDNKLKINIDFIKFIKNTLIFTALSRIKNYFVSMLFY